MNIESQDDFYPGYPLTKRGVYYGCRMISSQYGTVFSNSHYEKLEKVYSIWICTAPPKHRRNSINIYSLSEKHLCGNTVLKKENYDLITVVMIFPGDEDDENCTGLLRLLSVFFSSKRNAAEKIKILENEFGIMISQKYKKEVNEMCNYSQHVRKEGIAEATLLACKNLIKNMHLTPEQAMNVLEIPMKERNQYADNL